MSSQIIRIKKGTDEKVAKAEFLIEELLGEHILKYNRFDEYIKKQAEEIKKLKDAELQTTDSKERSKIQKEIQRANKIYKLYVNQKAQAMKKLNELQALVTEFVRYASEVNMSGSPVSYHGFDFETIYGTKSVYNPLLEPGEIVKDALTMLGEKPSIIHNEEYKIRKKMEKCAEKIIKLIEKDKGKKEDDIYDFNFSDGKEHFIECSEISELLQVGEEKILDTLIYLSSYKKIIFKYSDEPIKLPGTVITVDVTKVTDTYSNDNSSKYCESFIEEIGQIDYILKQNETSPTKNQLQINKLKEARDLYSKYATRFIAYKIIEYYIPQLKNHPKAIQKLKEIVKKEAKNCLNLKIKADKIYYSVNKKQNNVGKTIVTQQYEEEKTDEYSEKEVVEETKTEPEKDVNYLISLSSGYRARYIQEKIKGTDLGKLNYSEYLKKIVPEEKELIAYIEKQEKKAANIFAEYTKDRAYRIQNKYPIIRFKDFVEKRFDIDYHDLELTTEIEEKLKGMKAL